MEKYILTDTLFTFIDENGNLLLNLPNEENLTFEDVDMLSKLLEILLVPASRTDILEKMYENKYDLEDGIDDILVILTKNNIIKKYHEYNIYKKYLSNHDRMKYDRQIAHFSSQKGENYETALISQNKIINSSVLIIGVGGIGSYLSSGLASIGVGNITLIDFDKIELSNTSRQILFQEVEIGLSKLDIAKKKLSKINPQCNIETLELEIKAISDLEILSTFTFDVVILCADQPRGEIQYIIDSYCHSNDVPFLLGGPFAQGSIFLGPFVIPKKTKSYSEMAPQPDFSLLNDGLRAVNNRSVSAIIDTDNAIAAKMMEVEIIKFLTKGHSYVESKQIVLNTQDWNKEEIIL
ncbi:ThiF family adenylyltransferase [Streptococcus suis]